MSNNGIPPLNDWQEDNYPVIYDEGNSTSYYVKSGNKHEITGGGSSYLVYTGLLTQSGTDAPAADELQNDFGITEWTRFATGNYEAVSTIPSTYKIYINGWLFDPASSTGWVAYHNSAGIIQMYLGIYWYADSGVWVFGFTCKDGSFVDADLGTCLTAIGLTNGVFALPKIEAYQP